MADRLQAVIDAFESVPPDFRLDLLLDYARQFRPLPEHRISDADRARARVHECQAEVYLVPRLENGQVHLDAAIPEHAPTQRALLGILQTAYDGASPEAVARIPDDLLQKLGLADRLGIQRQHGFAGVLRLLKARVAEAAG